MFLRFLSPKTPVNKRIPVIFFLIFFTEKFAGIKNLFYLCTRKSETTATAKIAQLVEHDLAKVGVAGSSPVFRSLVRMAELVDALL